MTQTHDMSKRCFGYECQIRDRCAHYVRPISYAEHFFQPVERGENCHSFVERRRHDEYGND